MKRRLLTAVTCAVLWGMAALGQAQVSSKPVLVVSVSGYQSLRSDIQYLAGAADSAAMLKQFDGTLEALTNGLDKTKPWGAVVTLNGQEPTVVAFIPVTNLDQLLGGLAAFQFLPPPEDAGNGMKRIGPALIKEQDGYAFIAQKPEHLQNLPDPAKVLNGLNKKYAIAISGNVQNVPEDLRNMALGLVRQGADASLERNDGESDTQFELRKNLAAQQIKQLEQILTETDEVTIGWGVDAKAKNTFFDVVLTAVKGTKTAQQFARLKGSETKFGGVVKPDAPLALNLSTETTDAEEIDQVVAQIKAYKGAVMEMIDKSEDFDTDEERTVIKGWANEAMDILQATVEGGRFDFAVSLLSSENGPVSLLAGAHVAKGKALDSLVQQVLKMAEQNEEKFPKVKYNALTHKGTNIHTVALPLPEDADEAEKFTKVFGEKPTLQIGFSADTAWLSMGSDSVAALKTAIDGTGERKPIAPFQFSLSLGSLMRLAAELDQSNPTLLPLANAVPPGTDHVRMFVEAIENGERVRIEVGEGVIKLIGMGAKMQNASNRGAVNEN